MLKILDPAMTKTQTALLEKKLTDAHIRAWEIPTAEALKDTLRDVHADRVALGHCPSAEDKRLARQLTAGIRDRASNPKANVRTTPLGAGRFRVRLPRTTAEYAGIGSPEQTPWLTSLETAAHARITVTSVTVSRSDSWYRTVLLHATPAT